MKIIFFNVAILPENSCIYDMTDEEVQDLVNKHPEDTQIFNSYEEMQDEWNAETFIFDSNNSYMRVIDD